MQTTLIAAASMVTVGVVVAVWVRETRRQRHQQALVELLGLFGASVARVQAKPQELVAWADVAKAARVLFPDECRALDEASEGRFPFSRALVEGAHARWTSNWLAWEREHDLGYKRRADDIENRLADAQGDERRSLRALLAATEQEKLQRYQERYEEYVRIGKAMERLQEP